jgi:hypothetical protein
MSHREGATPAEEPSGRVVPSAREIARRKDQRNRAEFALRREWREMKGQVASMEASVASGGATGRSARTTASDVSDCVSLRRLRPGVAVVSTDGWRVGSVVIPAADDDRIDDDGVHVSLTKHAIARLPAVDLEQLAAGR